MSGNKPKAEQAQWAVQLLTPDYVVDGTFDPNNLDSPAKYFLLGNNDSWGHLSLNVTHLQPISSQAAPLRPSSRWIFDRHSLLIATIPRDEQSTVFMLQNNQSKQTYLADVYVGSFIVHGRMVVPKSQPGEIEYFTLYRSFAVLDAEIKHLYPALQPGVIKAPCVLVCTHFLQGIVPLA
jgi:hypothetical protein